MSSELSALCQRLSHLSIENSIEYHKELIWPENLQFNQWFLSPELMTIQNQAIGQSLSEESLQKLSFYELINFFSMNIHGERNVISRMAMLLYTNESHKYSNYLHHFLGEENSHIEFFAKFCLKYAGKVYPDTSGIPMPTDEPKPEEEFLFYVKILIFEECLDRYNKIMSMDERLPDIVRKINLLHHKDEARHLAFGRKFVAELFENQKSDWSTATLAEIRHYITDYIEFFWRDLFNVRVYQDAGLSGDVFDLREHLMTGLKAQQHYQNLTDKVVNFFLKTGILIEKPMPKIILKTI